MRKVHICELKGKTHTKRNVSGNIRFGIRSLLSNLRKRNQQIAGVKLKGYECSIDRRFAFTAAGKCNIDDGQRLHSDGQRKYFDNAVLWTKEAKDSWKGTGVGRRWIRFTKNCPSHFFEASLEIRVPWGSPKHPVVSHRLAPKPNYVYSNILISIHPCEAHQNPTSTASTWIWRVQATNLHGSDASERSTEG